MTDDQIECSERQRDWEAALAQGVQIPVEHAKKLLKDPAKLEAMGWNAEEMRRAVAAAESGYQQELTAKRRDALWRQLSEWRARNPGPAGKAQADYVEQQFEHQGKRPDQLAISPWVAVATAWLCIFGAVALLLGAAVCAFTDLL